jgi:Zn-dependent protease with chaperone function
MKKYFISLFVILWLLFLPCYTVLNAQTSDEDIELWSYMMRQSQLWYENMLKQQGVVLPGEWQVPIESAFIKLSMFSGEKGFQIQYAVLKGEAFNAAAFPGGQFVIFHGTLTILDQMIEYSVGQPLNKITADNLQVMRENIIAPILAHELGHYYNRHSFKTMKESWSLIEKDKDNFDLGMLKYSQKNEFEADSTGYLLLQKAGYNPDSMVAILELLNAMQQGQIKGVSATSFNVYLSTHPSPHNRLAQFAGKNQEWHKWAANMEQAVSDIALGMNLAKAIKKVDEGLKLAPDNIYLLKVRAVACHKQWLATVSLADQKLRGVIDLPAFRDEMVYSQIKMRGPKKIPGDKKLYNKARDAYKAVYQKSVDPGFYSNFALLLAYSPAAKDETESLNLAKQACVLQPNYANFSNLGVVYFLLDKKTEALQLFGEIAADYHEEYSEFLGAADIDGQVLASLQDLRQQLKLTQRLNPEFVYSDFTPVLNFALALALMNDKETAKAVATDYLNYYEFTSSWAKHLSVKTGVPLPSEPVRKYIPVKGIEVGFNLNQLVEKWGKASEIYMYETGEELWYYADIQTKVYILDGLVIRIELVAAESPKLENEIGVGSSKKTIEKVFGFHKRMADQFLIYEGQQNLAVLYSSDIAINIILF